MLNPQIKLHPLFGGFLCISANVDIPTHQSTQKHSPASTTHVWMSTQPEWRPGVVKRIVLNTTITS